MKKTLSSRYTFDIISLSANSKNKLIEIEYNYTGVLLIPKHLKKTVKGKKFSVSGLFTINANIKDLVLNKNYKNISKKEVVDFSKELKEVKDQQTDINGILLNIGNAEVVKTQMVTKHIELQQAWKKMTQALEKKYGAVNISLEDGTLSPIEEAEKK